MSQVNKITNPLGTIIWQQFMENKLQMLRDYESAKGRSLAHTVHTFHGKVAEAVFRKWLESFLPKQYGVTSGYLVSQGDVGDFRLNHFDVIVYDQVACPILWVDENPDASSQGKSRAIPVEHVCGVFEVKSTVSTRSVTEAFAKLDELAPYLDGLDEYSERYKRFLRRTFFSSVVFFELQEKEHFNQLLLDPKWCFRRGYYGTVILSAGGQARELTGVTKLLCGKDPVQSTIAKDKESLVSGFALGNSILHGDDHFTVAITWGHHNFSQVAFDFLSLMDGTYLPNRASSFHGMGFRVGGTLMHGGK